MSASGPEPPTNHEFNLAAQMAAIVESSGDAIIGKTLDGTIMSWNAGATRMYGYLPGDVIGRNISLMLPADGKDELDAIFDRLRHGERVEPYDTRRLCKDGSIIEISLCVSPIKDRTGTVVGASAVGRDITRRNRAHHAERLETLGRLAGGIAHDYNNLLAIVYSYAEFIADETIGQPRVRADAECIQDAAARAMKLTRQLLMFSRREQAAPVPLDLAAVINDIADLLRTSVAHVELRLSPSAQPAIVMADRGQLEQVLLNLTVNAGDAMPEGGTLTIAVDHTRLGGADVHADPDPAPGPGVELTVSDTGTGIPPDVAAHIFEPFFTTKPVSEGTGLGLSTVYGIITAAGGTITLDSVEGTGSTFRIRLPALTEPADPKVSATTPPASQPTILVVDDEPAVLAATCRILRKYGYNAIEASSGDDAVTLALTSDFQLLVTDSVLQHMSGATLAHRIAALKPGVPVLHMSGDASEFASEALLRKPFTAAQLIEKVHVTLNAPRRPANLPARSLDSSAKADR
jgi:two-component system cell cycle sensor histidine kinase/response regulator CckA